MSEEGIKKILEDIPDKVGKFRNYRLVSKDEVIEGLMKQKQETTILSIALILVHVWGTIAKLILDKPYLWNILAGFWSGTRRLADDALNGFVMYLPGEIPIKFPFDGTCGLFVGGFMMWLFFEWYWEFSEKLGEFAGMKNIYDKEGKKIGKFLPPIGGTWHVEGGTWHVEGDLMVNVHTHIDDDTPTWKKTRRILHSWWPFYLGPDQLRVDKYMVIATVDSLEPRYNSSHEDNHLKDDLVDTGFYYYNDSGSVIKVFTCGKVTS